MAQTRFNSLAMPFPAISKAVPWPTEVRMIGKPARSVTTSPKLRSLDAILAWSWYMARTRSYWPSRAWRKTTPAGTGPMASISFGPGIVNRRDGTGLFLRPKQPTLAAVRIEAGNRDARVGNAKGLERFIGKFDHGEHFSLGD